MKSKRILWILLAFFLALLAIFLFFVLRGERLSGNYVGKTYALAFHGDRFTASVVGGIPEVEGEYEIRREEGEKIIVFTPDAPLTGSDLIFSYLLGDEAGVPFAKADGAIKVAGITLSEKSVP